MTIDPTDSYNEVTVALESDLLIRSLTQYDFDPVTRQVRLVPDLATDLGRHNVDYTVWRYTLRRGIKFDNGRPVTAADMKFGIERSFDRVAFTAGPQYSNEYFVHGGSYRGPYRTPGPYSGVQVSGRTLTLRMSKPFPDMPYFAATPAMSPIPSGKVSNPATYKNHPWATGPYTIASYSPGRSLVLVRNQQWDPATDLVRHQYVDRYVIDFPHAVDRHQQARVLSDVGSAQSTILLTDVSKEFYPRFKESAPDRLIRGTVPCTAFWIPDFRRTDLAVRRALAYAFPYRAYELAKGLIPGVTTRAATAIMAPGTPGRLAYNPLPGHLPGRTQPAKARAILTRAGDLHFEVRFPDVTDAPEEPEVNAALVRALRRAGFTARAVPETSATYMADVTVNPRASENVRLLGWCADWPSGAMWMPQLFARPGHFERAQHANYADFASATVAHRIRSTERLPLVRQQAAWSALERWIQRRYFVMIPLRYYATAKMRGSKVHSAFIDPVYGMPTYEDIWLG